MKIKVNKDRLAEAVNTVKDVAADTGLEIIKNVKVETVGDDSLRVTATNLDVQITADAPCEVAEKGATTVRAKLLSQIVGALPSGCMVEFASDENNVDQASLVGGEAKFRLATLPVSEFPSIGGVEGLEFVFEESVLRGLLRRTFYAASDDAINRRILTGVCVQAKDGVVTAVATDGRRLSCASMPPMEQCVGKDFEMALPMASVKCLMRMMTGGGLVKVSLKPGSQARFSAEGWTLQTKLVDDVYPNWRRVVPAGEMKSAVIDRNGFMEAVKQSATTASVANTSILVEFKDGYIGLKSKTGDGSAASSVKVSAKSEDGGTSILFAPKYILDALGAIPSNSVSFNYSSAAEPVTFTCEDDGGDAVAVLMPIRMG